LSNSGFTEEAATGFSKALLEYQELNNLDLDLNENPKLGDNGAVSVLKTIFNMDK
jgi:hypothetical protein